MAAGGEFIPFALPCIGEEEINEVVATLRSGWLTTGPKCRQFEADFAAFIGIPNALAVNSATAGLHLALEAAGVGPGDYVATTTYTFTATAEVARYLGADLLFVDIDPATFNLDPGSLSRALDANRRVKAIVPVHFAGQACDMEPIMELARERGCVVIEDAAHALPASYRGRAVGTLADIAVFSFYATKTIATGEGGMVVTANDDWARRIRTMRLHGINRDVFDRYSSHRPSWYYEVVAPGFKYNLTDVAAAIGIQQLRKAHRFLARRREIATIYDELLAGLPLRTPLVRSREDLHSWHLYVIQMDLDRLTIGRDRCIELLAERGIGTSVHFIPLHMQPYWREKYRLAPAEFPVATDVYRRAISLPIYPGLSDSQVARIAGELRDIVTSASSP
jgi:dTDP-4-amino-4,6-dideoxygalactose transaminase